MLEGKTGSYTAAVNLDVFRAVFRRTRKNRVGGADKLAELAGINRATIYKIETDKSYIPGIDTLTTLVEAMPGLTLSEFFSQIERQTDADSTESYSSVTTHPPLRPTAASEGKPSYGGPSPGIRHDEVEDSIIEDALLDMGNRLIDAIGAIHAARRQTAEPRPARPRRPSRDRKHGR